MKKTLISTAIATSLALGASSAQALTVTLLPNNNPLATYPATDAANNGAFNGAFDLQMSAPNEFRVMNGGAVSGGGEKSIVDGLQTWEFTDFGGTLTAVGGTDIVPAATTLPSSGALGISGPGMFLNAEFLFPGGFFGFLAPIGTAAANGPATINGTTDNFTMSFPILEAHWSGGAFSIGKSNGGVDITCVALHCTGDQQIAPADDTLGFANQWVQFEFDVTVDPTVIPVPAAVWLFGSGLLGLVGVARRKKQA
jgi:hypothetical protein